MRLQQSRNVTLPSGESEACEGRHFASSPSVCQWLHQPLGLGSKMVPEVEGTVVGSDKATGPGVGQERHDRWGFSELSECFQNLSLPGLQKWATGEMKRVWQRKISN